MADKIDSNLTGLRFAEETSIGVLPVSPVWYPLEPNSYEDFGGQITTVTRNPINPSRQRKKGVTSDMDASGGLNQDLTFANTTRLMQGFMFADIREKKTTAPMNGTAIAITGVTASDDTYAAASGLTNFLAGHLVLASGFGVPANNGLKVVASASTATDLVVGDGLVDEASPPAAAVVKAVGYQFASGTVDIALSGSLVHLERASGTVDFTTFGLIPGEWVFLGGDTVGTQFDDNQGFARILSVAAALIVFDKVSWTPTAETGTGKTVRMFFGDVIKNENDPALIVRRSYNVERTLGSDANGVMSEYLVGAVPNEFTLNVTQADKVMVDLAFAAIDNEQRNGATGVKSGSRPTLAAGDAYNTSDNFARIKMAIADPDDASPVALFAFATELSITINNNVSPNKAIGVLGAFDMTTGTFEVGGSMQAYFASIDAVQAVRNNSDVTVDVIMVRNNSGLLFDLPLISLGDGRLNVEQDQSIMLPLETNAAESDFGHTMLFGSFSYLPDLAG